MNDPVVIRLIGGVEGLEKFPELSAMVGEWVVDYIPEFAVQGERWIWTTPNKAEAKRYTAEQAFAAYHRSINWNGRPDRPITAFHITVEPLE
jgi:hypothetical protein